jgi:glycerophosphoryl diester phosphodiesterase
VDDGLTGEETGSRERAAGKQAFVVTNQKLETRNQKLLLLGHRGARRYAPENTIAAFALALEHGCDGFEFDLRRTRDGRAVVCHDRRFHRRNIGRCNYSSLVEAYSSLACFEDVIARYRSRAFLYIEIKVPGLEEDLVRTLRQSPPECGYVVASFLPKILRAVHEHAGDQPGVPLGLIARDRAHLAKWRKLPLAYVMPHRSLVSRRLVNELHSAGKRVLVWTVNRERAIREVAELGVDGIVSDDTQLLCSTLGRLRY